MNKIILLGIILLGIKTTKAQFPIIENFNVGTTWTFSSGGIQNYSGAENYATFNIGSTPYAHNSTITITSPVYNLSTCGSNVDVTFPLNGVIQNSSDYMYFDYYNGTTWVNVSSFTGVKSATSNTYSIPNTATQFRFRLVTDGCVNAYKGGAFNPCSLIGYPTTCTPSEDNCNGSISVYFYDIASFTIACTTLPITLSYFIAEVDDSRVNLKWQTLTELNNHYFELYRTDVVLNTILGFGTTNILNNYECIDNTPEEINYYKLRQYDYDGKYTDSKIIIAKVNKVQNNLEIYDITGKFVGTSTNDLPPGIYILVIDKKEYKKIYK